MQEISFTVTRRDDETVRMCVVEPASIRVAGDSTFRSVVALERALERVGLPPTLARQTGRSTPLPVSLAQLSRLGFL